ncbi:MAG: hypothetical protein ACPGVB_00960 [Chitinophagales bacterium]
MLDASNLFILLLKSPLASTPPNRLLLKYINFIHVTIMLKSEKPKIIISSSSHTYSQKKQLALFSVIFFQKYFYINIFFILFAFVSCDSSSENQPTPPSKPSIEVELPPITDKIDTLEGGGNSFENPKYSLVIFVSKDEKEIDTLRFQNYKNTLDSLERLLKQKDKSLKHALKKVLDSDKKYEQVEETRNKILITKNERLKTENENLKAGKKILITKNEYLKTENENLKKEKKFKVDEYERLILKHDDYMKEIKTLFSSKSNCYRKHKKFMEKFMEKWQTN